MSWDITASRRPLPKKLFELISRAYERLSIIETTNPPIRLLCRNLRISEDDPERPHPRSHGPSYHLQESEGRLQNRGSRGAETKEPDQAFEGQDLDLKT